MVSRVLVCCMLVLVVEQASADISVSGLTDFVVKNSGEFEYDVTNVTFKNFSNFHTMRTRLYLDSKVDENLSMFVQVLINNNTFSLYGAYLRLEHVGFSWLNANVGYIPATVGAFGPRTYSDKNPLIGQPLMYLHHSNLFPGRTDSVNTVDDFLAARTERSRFGLPVIYDACWNTGLELYGSSGNVDLSLGLLTGSVGYTTLEQHKDIPQLTTHIVMHHGPSLSIGVSGWAGPYLFEDALGYETGSEEYNYSEYLNTGGAFEFQWMGEYLSCIAEAAYTNWEHPILPNLGLTAGYIESQFKFAPAWYLAGRFDFWEPSKLTNSAGMKQKWDFPVTRLEAGIGYHPYRHVTTKLVLQMNRFDGGPQFNTNLYAAQMSIGF